MHYLLTWLKVLKFTLKYTIISLLHVSVFNDHHQEASLNVLVCKPEGKRPLGRPRRRWVDNVRMDLQEVNLRVP